MELKDFIKGQLDGADQAIKRAIDTLTQKEIEWQPKSGCNSIGLILFHVYQTEDSFINHLVNGKDPIFKTNKWYEKVGLPTDVESAHFASPEAVDAFKVPKLQPILDYGVAVHKNTLKYLDTLKPADFDKKIEMRFGPMPLAMVFSILVSHAASHTGEMSYIRGIQRGMDK